MYYGWSQCAQHQSILNSVKLFSGMNELDRLSFTNQFALVATRAQCDSWVDVAVTYPLKYQALSTFRSHWAP